MRFVCPKSLVVLVTGGTSGIGEATARRFCGSGSRVIVTGRREDRLETLKRELGDRLQTIHCDVTDTPGMERALSSLPDGFREISVLVNNAGAAFGLRGADEGNLDDWNKMVDINIKGLLATTHFVLPRMVERRKGHVINLGSTAGSYPYPGGNVYGATKAFVKMFSLNLRADLLGKNIRVTNVEPGMTSTEFSVVRFGGDVERASNVYKGMQPMTADDIAEMVYWCATMPEHVNINRIECMPTSQAFNAFAIARDS